MSATKRGPIRLQEGCLPFHVKEQEGQGNSSLSKRRQTGPCTVYWKAPPGELNCEPLTSISVIKSKVSQVNYVTIDLRVNNGAK